MFATSKEAAKAYDRFAIRAGRPASKLNFPDQVPQKYQGKEYTGGRPQKNESEEEGEDVPVVVKSSNKRKRQSSAKEQGDVGKSKSTSKKKKIQHKKKFDCDCGREFKSIQAISAHINYCPAKKKNVKKKAKKNAKKKKR